MTRAGLASVTVLLLFAGCAGLGPLARPEEFPFHATDHPFFDLHWRLDLEAGSVSAVGLVEATRQGNFSAVYLSVWSCDWATDGDRRRRGM